MVRAGKGIVTQKRSLEARSLLAKGPANNLAGSRSGETVWPRNSNELNGYASHVTNHVPSDLDKGTATGVCSAILFGNWADLIMAFWGVVDVVVDPYTLATSGKLRITTTVFADIAVRHPESFAAMKDALTA